MLGALLAHHLAIAPQTRRNKRLNDWSPARVDAWCQGAPASDVAPTATEMRRLQAIIIAALVATASSTTTEHWVYASSPSATATNADDQAATWPALTQRGPAAVEHRYRDSSDASIARAAEGSLHLTFSAATLTLKTTGHNLQAVPPTSANMKTNIRGDDYNLAQGALARAERKHRRRPILCDGGAFRAHVGCR